MTATTGRPPSSTSAETRDARTLGLDVAGLSHVVIEVADLGRAEAFYREVLGFARAGRDRWPDCGRHAVLRVGAGQRLVLAERQRPRTLPGTGVHQAYRAAERDRAAVLARLARLGVEVRTYREDRPAEAEDNVYFADPDGNRVQLVAAGDEPGGRDAAGAIDHAAVECFDLEWAEDFYVEALGLGVEHRVGWRTEDYVRARRWGEGREAMAPGTRRWDRRYTAMEDRQRLPRPNPHFFVRLGAAVLGIYLATEHRQEPPEEQHVGTPRIGFAASRAGLDAALARLARHRFPAGVPVEHPPSAPLAASLYVRDPSGNFLEFCVPRSP